MMKKITIITALFLFVFVATKAQRTIIKNPGFEDGIEGWSTVSDKATFDIDGNSLITGLKSAHIKIVTQATNYFESGIFWGFITPKNASYNLKFKAKSSKACDIRIEVSEAHGPNYKLLGQSQVANLTTTTNQFEFNFSGEHTSDGRFGLKFFTGELDLGTDVWIDDVILTETSASSNLTNGDSWDDFNIEMPSKINGWETWLCCGAPGVSSPNINFSVIDNANSIIGKTMQVQSIGLVEGQELDLWRAQFAWWFTPIKGAQYTFKFKAKASTEATISYEIVSQNGDPNAAVGDPNRANWILGGRPWIQEVVPTTVKSYSFTTLPIPTWDNYKISFWFGGVPAGTTLWLDDVELIQTVAVNSGKTNSSDITCTICDVNVGSGAELIIDSSNTLKSVSVAPGGKLTLNNTYTINTTNGVTLTNSTSGTASFLDTRTSDNPSAIAGTVEQIIAESNRNWYVALPVSGKSAADITFTGSKIVERNEAQSSWDEVTGSLTTGIGYIALASTNSGSTSWSLSGNLNSGKVEVPVTRSGVSSAGFNLIGNPYPSFLNWEQVLNLNENNASILQSSIWYRTKSAGSYLFQIYNSSGHIATPKGTSGYIPPMQAFWVRANSSGTVSFTNEMRSHGDGQSNLLKVPKKINQKIIRLQLSNASSNDETVLYFDENAQNTFDKYDTQKIFNSDADKPEIFSYIGNEQLAINGFHEVQYDKEIPLGFVTGQSTEFSISGNEITNFDPGTQIILKDKLNPANEFDLSQGTSYNFSSTATASSDRFSLIFRAPSNITNLKSAELLDAQIFVNTTKQITIVAPEKCNYVIYNTIGRVIDKGITGRSSIQTSNYINGLYIVKLSNNGKELISRIIIK